MADINGFPLHAPSPELVPVPFRVKLDGANNGVIQEGNKLIKSFVHTAGGRYTLNLKDKFQEIVAATLDCAFAAPVDLVPQVKSFDTLNAAAPTLGGKVVISLLAAAVETDPPAFAGNNGYLFGVLWLRNSGNPS